MWGLTDSKFAGQASRLDTQQKLTLQAWVWNQQRKYFLSCYHMLDMGPVLEAVGWVGHIPCHLTSTLGAETDTSSGDFIHCGYFINLLWEYKENVFSLVAQTVKDLPILWETRIWSLGEEDPLEKEMTTHSSTLAWKIPWTDEHGRLQSMGSQRVGHDWATSFYGLYSRP